MRRACLNLFAAMTKEEFVKRLVEHFNGIAKAAKGEAEAEIMEADQRLTFEPFCAWLERKRARALRYPFSRVLKPTSTPSGAARDFANLLAIDAETGAAIDWAQRWERAAPILANRQPERSDGWKYGNFLRDYIAAVRGHACASAFSRRISDGIELSKKVLRGEIAGGKEYQSTWRYWKGLLKDPSLTEARFLQAETEETEGRIRELESGEEDKELMRLHREKLRVFKKRLEALEQKAAKNATSNKPAVSEPRTFAELLKIPDDEKSVVSALVGAHLIFEDTTQWKDQRTTGAIRAVFEALEDAKMIHEIELTPGCRLIAKRFGVKVVKNYPKAGFTDKLRRGIKSLLDNNRDNNRDGI